MKHLRAKRWIVLGLLTVVAETGWAQDAPTATPEGPTATPEEPAPAGPPPGQEGPPSDAPTPPPPYATDWRWSRRSPVRGEAVFDVAVKPGEPETLLAIDETGTVWRSRDSGRIWSVVLGATVDEGLELSSDEDVLLDIDARLEEILADGDNLGLDPELDESEVEDAVATAVDEAVDQGGSEVLTDIESDPGFVLRSATGVDRTPPRITYVGDTLFASVGGLLYLSRDDGQTWGEVLDRHAYDVVSLGSAYVALTDDGARLALDPRAWVDFEDGTEGLTMVDGELASEVLLAATPDGLWASRDGQAWARWGTLRQPVRALAVHPDRPDVVWALTPTGAVRSGDRGLTFGAPRLLGQLDDIVVPWPDRVVAVRPGNVLESRDDGITWQPATAGLSGVPGGRLEVSGEGGLFLATTDGLWVLREETDRQGAEAPTAFVGLEQLVGAALSRVGVQRNYNAFGRRYASVAMPTLQVDGWYFPGEEGNDWGPTTGTRFERAVRWFVRARLTWTPRRTRQVALQDLDDPIDIEANVVVLGDEPLLLTGEDDYVVAARLQRDLLTSQSQLAATVSDLYRTRAELVAERGSLRTARLQRQVNHELAIAELEARLDALTDGAVTRWQASQEPTQEL